jgi:hypothetical protein
MGRFALPDEVIVAAAHTAAALDPPRRRAAVADLVAELVAMGTTAATLEAALPVAPVVPAEDETAAAAPVTTSG